MNENKFSYEKSINRIKEISEILKNNPTNFEENLQLFSEAMLLIKKCQSYIQEAELKVKAIIDGEIQEYDIENPKIISTKPINSISSNTKTANQDDDLPF